MTAELLYKNALSTNLIAIGGSIIITLFFDSLITSSLLPWLVVMQIVSFGRLFLYSSYRIDKHQYSPAQWINYYSFASFCAGAAWAGIVWYLPESRSAYTTSAFYLVILVPLTGTLPTLSVSLRTFHAFAAPIFAASISFFLIEPTTLSFYISIAAVMYTFFMISTGRHIHRHIQDGFQLQLKNQSLIASLNDEIAQRNEAQAQLQRNQQALENTVNVRTSELRQTNEILLKEINERKRVEENLKHLAHHDALTSLPNRLLLNDRLNHAMDRANRNHQKVAVLFIDLDHFKNINDSLGHDVGDALIVEIAKRLQDSVRDVDTVARLGGDEFIILIEQVEKTSDLNNVLNKIRTATSQTTTIRDHELYTSASIGISIYPDHGHTVEQLLRNADAAMYQAKETGRNRHQFYTSELTTTAYDRVILETDLRHAIEHNQFEVFYQPQINLTDGAIIGAEALIRWNHPTLGMLSPDQFLPIAEHCGMMNQLGEWVLKTACNQMASWKTQGYAIQTIAVNLSGSQIRHSDITQTVKRILKESRCRTEWLELEITEDFIIKETESSIDTLHDLKKLGISLAIDDFGTGYSSLNHLKRLPVNKLKIDRSFVCDIHHDMEDAALVQAIISMGQSLGLKLVAEGVESHSHEVFLQAHDCTIVQGYRYSRPVPAKEIQTFFDEFKLQRNPIKLCSGSKA